MLQTVVAKSAVVVFRAMLGLFRRVRIGHKPASHAKGKIIIMEHPATDYKPSNPK